MYEELVTLHSVHNIHIGKSRLKHFESVLILRKEETNAHFQFRE